MYTFTSSMFSYYHKIEVTIVARPFINCDCFIASIFSYNGKLNIVARTT